jgi:hypothetical protein
MNEVEAAQPGSAAAWDGAGERTASAGDHRRAGGQAARSGERECGTTAAASIRATTAARSTFSGAPAPRSGRARTFVSWFEGWAGGSSPNPLSTRVRPSGSPSPNGSTKRRRRRGEAGRIVMIEDDAGHERLIERDTRRAGGEQRDRCPWRTGPAARAVLLRDAGAGRPVAASALIAPFGRAKPCCR